MNFSPVEEKRAGSDIRRGAETSFQHDEKMCSDPEFKEKRDLTPNLGNKKAAGFAAGGFSIWQQRISAAESD